MVHKLLNSEHFGKLCEMQIKIEYSLLQARIHNISLTTYPIVKLRPLTIS